MFNINTINTMIHNGGHTLIIDTRIKKAAIRWNACGRRELVDYSTAVFFLENNVGLTIDTWDHINHYFEIHN